MCVCFLYVCIEELQCDAIMDYHGFDGIILVCDEWE